MRVVIALGGNALLQRSDPMTTEVQRRNVKVAAEVIAPLAAGHSIVVVHGNGPQVGLLSLLAEATTAAEPYPLDVLDADTNVVTQAALEGAATGSSSARHQQKAAQAGMTEVWTDFIMLPKGGRAQ
jgi:carbamate kinase